VLFGCDLCCHELVGSEDENGGLLAIGRCCFDVYVGGDLADLLGGDAEAGSLRFLGLGLRVGRGVAEFFQITGMIGGRLPGTGEVCRKDVIELARQDHGGPGEPAAGQSTVTGSNRFV